MSALPPKLSDQDFANYRQWLLAAAGIQLRDSGRHLIESRIGNRLAMLGLDYANYLALIIGSTEEKEIFLNRITTNETYFFREVAHFDFLGNEVLPALKSQLPKYRAWSAASSSGEEAYTLAMVLDNVLGNNRWEVVGSDISTQMIEQARTARYTAPRLQHTPDFYRKKYMLQGVGICAGQIKIVPYLRNHVTFHNVNLKHDLPALGLFDVIFLRNVLIYFDADMRLATVKKLLRHLKYGGYLITSMTESLSDLPDELRFERAGIYRKVADAWDAGI